MVVMENENLDTRFEDFPKLVEELGRLRLEAAEKDRVILDLQNKVVALEYTLNGMLAEIDEMVKIKKYWMEKYNDRK